MTDKEEKMSAIAGVMDASLKVRTIRTDPNIAAMLANFVKRSNLHIDLRKTLDSMRALKSVASMPVFEIEGTDALASAAEWRIQARNDRAFCIGQLRDLRELNARVKRMMRVMRPYLRELLDDVSIKAADEIISVALDPIFTTLETYQEAIDAIKDTMTVIDDTADTISAWFNVHKQHVFLTRNTHDPEEPKTEKTTSGGRSIRR